MSRTWHEPRDVGVAGAAVTQRYQIGEFATGKVFLASVPTAGSVTVPGYTEIASGSPTATQFVVDTEGDNAGTLTFNTSEDGKNVDVSYTEDALGSMHHAAFTKALQRYKADDVEAVKVAAEGDTAIREQINQANIAGLTL